MVLLEGYEYTTGKMMSYKGRSTTYVNISKEKFLTEHLKKATK